VDKKAGMQRYLPLERKGYQHDVAFLRGKKKTPSELMPRVHRVISLLKRWRMGTHQGAVSQKHLDYYLDEFTFRFNRRRSRSRDQLFFRPRATSRSSRVFCIGSDSSPCSQAENETTICMGHLSQADTHLEGFARDRLPQLHSRAGQRPAVTPTGGGSRATTASGYSGSEVN
jgi:hypothetical protein